MATSQYISTIKYPLTVKPLTHPDNKPTYQDIFNLANTLRLLIQNIDENIISAPPVGIIDNSDDVENGTLTPPAMIRAWGYTIIEGNPYYIPLYKVAGPEITTVFPATLTVGVPITPIDFTATGGTSPYLWSISKGYLPVGLNLISPDESVSGEWSIEGTPTTVQSSEFNVTVLDDDGIPATVVVNISVEPAP